jgi:NADH-quinone oxidoreductase subunit M
MNTCPLISGFTLAPLVAAFLIILCPPGNRRLIPWIALLGSLVSLALVLAAVFQFNPRANLQFVENHPWIPSLNLEYLAGLDGLSVLVVLLTALLAPISILASWNLQAEERSKSYFALLSLQFTGLFGAFTALSFYHWFIFWELSLVPGFFLIKMFGGPRRHEAALSFFLFTVFGSVFMLLGFQYLYFKTNTFNFNVLAEMASSGRLPAMVGPIYPWIFLAILLGLIVKIPLFPLHIWQPEAYTQAPAPVSMIFSALLSKLGVYGFLRVIMLIFPHALQVYSRPLLGLALITILLGAFAALRQNDLKKLLAYSSLNHVGYCLLGCTAAALVIGRPAAEARNIAIQGAILQMFSHGLTVAGLFYLAGILECKSGTTILDNFGGLRKTMPRCATLFAILVFSSLGLPFLAGFSSEFLIFYGTFALYPAAAALAVIALLVTALFLLNLLQKVFTGPIAESCRSYKDLNLFQVWIALPLIVLIFWVGLSPGPWLRLSAHAVNHLALPY